MSAGNADAGLRRGPMLLIATVGVIAFLAMLLLGAYAPNFKGGRNGGTHALSTGGTGFAGIVRLAQDSGRAPRIVRNKAQFDTENLLVVSPDSGRAPMDPIMSQRGARVTLLILPKWETQADEQNPAWVEVSRLIRASVPEGVLAPGTMLDVSRRRTSGEKLTVAGHLVSSDIGFVAPRISQAISGKNVEAVLSDAKGRILLGRVGDRPLYVLAEPDLLNNYGLRNRDQAFAALRLLDDLNSNEADGIMFDVTANGLGHSRSPLQLAFDPPFLAVTLTLFAAMLLAGWQTLVRFGAPQPTLRALAFGKAALVDNSAALIRKAKRETRLGGRYAEVLRQRASASLSLPASLDADARSARLDGLRAPIPFSALAAASAEAQTRPELVAAAQSLHDWLKEVHR